MGLEVQETSNRERLVQAVPQIRKYVGTPMKRVEDRRLLTGRDHYLDNIKLPDMAYAGFVRSPYAHAKIRNIDVSKIGKNPQVVAVLTPEEVRAESGPIPIIWTVQGAKLHEHLALAQGKVKHVGDPVVAVAVRDRQSLEDILEMVEVEYEPLEPVVDPITAVSYTHLTLPTICSV